MSTQLKKVGVTYLTLFFPKGLMKEIVTTRCTIAEKKNWINRVNVSRKTEVVSSQK
jgi:hypothetical protein